MSEDKTETINRLNITEENPISNEDIEFNDRINRELATLSDDDIRNRLKMLENNIRIMNNEHTRLNNEKKNIELRKKENEEKIKLNKQLPFLVSNVVEILDLEPEINEDEVIVDQEASSGGISVIIKTSTRQTIFLPNSGLVPHKELQPNDLIGVNKDSYLIFEKLPAE
jgi:26S proteasome regulatory subunit T5